MNEKIIIEIANQLEPQLFILLLKLFGVGVGILLLKGFAESVTAYIQFRLDKNLNKWVKVRVRGKDGQITDYNFSWIFVKTNDGLEIISMRRWRLEKWTVINGDS